MYSRAILTHHAFGTIFRIISRISASSNYNTTTYFIIYLHGFCIYMVSCVCLALPPPPLFLVSLFQHPQTQIGFYSAVFIQFTFWADGLA